MKKNLLLILLVTTASCCLTAQTLYNNSTLAGNIFNPGKNVQGNPKIVLDDVNIPSSTVGGGDSIAVTKVVFGIYRAANAEATTVNFYYTPKDDTASFNNYNNFVKIPPVLLGSMNLAANGATAVQTYLSFGDSVNTLFKVKADTGKIYTGFSTLFLGVSFSTTAGAHWRFSTGGANDDVMWIYNGDSAVQRYASYFGGSPRASFYTQVYGRPVGGSLPVKLTTFTGKITGEDAMLNWSTSAEVNSQGFEIQRSFDGSDFTTIGFVAGAGNSNNVNNYQFTDKNIASGNNYYRLKQVDKDGKFEYSAIVKLNKTAKAVFEVKVINPAKDKVSLQVNSETAERVSVNLYNLNGQLVATKNTEISAGSNTLSIGQNLSKGSYIVTITKKGEVSSYKVLVD